MLLLKYTNVKKKEREEYVQGGYILKIGGTLQKRMIILKTTIF